MGDAGGIMDSASSGGTSLPVPHPTRSYWQQTNPTEIAHHRTTPNLPESASVVVIGTGISGAFAAKEFAAQGQDGIVVLEAREVCSGATGRNGGHCQPLIYEQPPEIAEFELRNYYAIANLVKDANVSCEYQQLKGGCHAYYWRKYFEEAKAETLELQRQYPHLMDLVEIVKDKSRLAALKVPDAVGALVQSTASSLSPHKLVTSIFKALLHDEKINLQTDTPVLSIIADCDADDASPHKWKVETDRGKISTSQVLLTTNAYTSHLLPQFTSLIVPVQGEMSALEPGSALYATPLDHTYAFIGVVEQDRMQDDYLVQRPRELGGELMFGGGRLCAKGAGVNTTDDSFVDKAAAKYLRAMLPRMLDLDGDGKKPVPEKNQLELLLRQSSSADELQAKAEWTGIMGFSRDGHPWVGAVPDMPGVWLCGGYSGHGMPNAGLSATHVVKMICQSMINAGDWEQAEQDAVKAKDIPAAYLISKDRMQKAREQHPEIRSEVAMQAPKQLHGVKVI